MICGDFLTAENQKSPALRRKIKGSAQRRRAANLWGIFVKKIFLGTAVWGDEYTDFYLNYHLPSLLAPGNIPALREALTYFIYTRAQYRDRILSHPSVIMLRDYAEVVLVIDWGKDVDARGTMTVAQRDLVARGWQADAGLIYTYPDTLLSDGGFRSIMALIETGKRAAMFSGLTANHDETLAALGVAGRSHETVLAGTDAPALVLGSRALVAASVANVHAASRAMFWTRRYNTLWHSVNYWELGGHGYLSRCYNLSPVFIHPDRPAKGWRYSFDGDLIEAAISRYDDIGILTDSDQFFWVELEPRDTTPPSGIPPTATTLAQWAWSGIIRPGHNFRLIHEKIWLHDGIERRSWRHIEQASDEIITEAEALYDAVCAGTIPPLPKIEFQEVCVSHTIWRVGDLFFGIPQDHGPAELTVAAVAAITNGVIGANLREVRHAIRYRINRGRQSPPGAAG